MKSKGCCAPCFVWSVVESKVRRYLRAEAMVGFSRGERRVVVLKAFSFAGIVNAVTFSFECVNVPQLGGEDLSSVAPYYPALNSSLD